MDLDLPLRQIKEAKAETLVGNGALRLITHDGRTIEAVRYTLGQAPAFSAAARALKSYLKDEEPPASLGDDLRKEALPQVRRPAARRHQCLRQVRGQARPS